MAERYRQIANPLATARTGLQQCLREEQTDMDDETARELLRQERTRTERLLSDAIGEGIDDRTAANQPGDMFDSAEPLAREGVDDSVIAELQRHMEAIARAEERLEAHTYGKSVRSGNPIPDDRLQADPTAELTVEEARQVGNETQ
jgi:DnaK suppressor protein